MNSRMWFPVAALGLAVSSSALAQQHPDWRMPWQDKFWGYVGASAGESKFRGTCSSLAFDCDQKDSAWGVHAGGNFNDLIGLELGYVDFGRMRAFGGDTDAKAANLSATVGFPIGERFSVFAKGGAAYGRTDVSASPTTFVSTGRKSDWGSKWGVGAAFGITRNLQARIDWDRYRLAFVSGDRDIDLLSAGLQFRY